MRQYLRWKKTLTATTAALFAVTLVLTGALQGAFFVPTAEAATFVVSPGSLQDWSFDNDGTASGSLVSGPGTPPMGSGSLFLSVGSDGSSGAQFRNDAYDDTPLEDLTSLRYSTYVTNNVNCQAPYLVLNIDTDEDGDVDDLLFFEPCYQNGTYTGSTVPDQGDVMLNTWQEWNALAGGWWTSSDGFGGPPLTTIADYVSENPNARIVNAAGGQGGVRIVAGFGATAWDDFTGNADAFAIGVDGVENIYDFEAMPPANGSSSSSSMMSSTGSSVSSSMTSSSLSSITCDPYADAAIAFEQGDQKGGGDVAANRSDTSKALGHPTAGSVPRFVSLGFSGSITLRFDNYIVNGPGADLRVFEATHAVNYPLERAQVWASQTGGGTWTFIGIADSSDNLNSDLNTSDIDLGLLPWARYIRLVDATNENIHANGADGFDVNALEALNNACSQPGSSSSSMSSTGATTSSSSSMSSTGSTTSSSSITSSSSSSLMAGGVPTCDGREATVYVDQSGMIVGGRDDGEEYDDVLRGTGGDDVIVGTDGDDRIYGGMGDDTICGGGGDDELDGGSGDDRLAGEDGDDELDASNDEDLLCGGAGDDELDGSNDADELDGGDGDDELDAGNGNDVCRNGEENEDCESSGGGSLAACSGLVSAQPAMDQ